MSSPSEQPSTIHSSFGPDDRRDGFHSAPPPRRVQRSRWWPSSVVIALGGIVSVLIAGQAGEVPIVGTVALIATIACGALLVAAQIIDDVRRARQPELTIPDRGRRTPVAVSRRTR